MNIKSGRIGTKRIFNQWLLYAWSAWTLIILAMMFWNRSADNHMDQLWQALAEQNHMALSGLKQCEILHKEAQIVAQLKGGANTGTDTEVLIAQLNQLNTLASPAAGEPTATNPNVGSVRLISQSPLNQNNKADPDSRAALEQLNRHSTPFVTQLHKREDGSSYWRMVVPIRNEASCTNCHQAIGQNQTVLGGIEVNVKAAPFMNAFEHLNGSMTFGYGAIWLTGILSMSLFSYKVKNRIQEIRFYQQELEHLATHDPLTDLYNRHEVSTIFKRELERSTRYDHPLAVLMIDIDFFKAINDQYGHGTGDAALVRVASLLRSNVRGLDAVARFGGEEFLIVMPETSLAMAKASAQRIRAEIEKQQLPVGTGEPLRLTVSIGVSAYPQHGSSEDELIRAADDALYTAKAMGRNRVQIAISSVH